MAGSSRSRSHSSHPAHSHSTHSHSTTQFEWGNQISGELSPSDMTPSGSPAYPSPSVSHAFSHPVSDDFTQVHDAAHVDPSFDGFLPMDAPHDTTDPSEASSMPHHSSYGSSPRTVISSAPPPVVDTAPIVPRGTMVRRTRRMQVIMPGQLPDRMRVQEGPSSFMSPSPHGPPMTDPYYPRSYPVADSYRWDREWNPNGAGPSRPARERSVPRLTSEDNRVIRDTIQSMQAPPTPRLTPAEYQTLMSDLRGLTQEARDQAQLLAQVTDTARDFSSQPTPMHAETDSDVDSMGLVISVMGILIGLMLLKMFFDIFH